MSDPLTRRTVLRGAAGGAAMLATASLPAWARPARKHHRRRLPDSLPFPHLPAGTPTMHELRHIVVVMMENHSFDNVLGWSRTFDFSRAAFRQPPPLHRGPGLGPGLSACHARGLNPPL